MYYLLLKTHSKTGLKYLCQTKRKDPVAYHGSGTRWIRHLRSHGFDFSTKISTQQVYKTKYESRD